MKNKINPIHPRVQEYLDELMIMRGRIEDWCSRIKLDENLPLDFDSMMASTIVFEGTINQLNDARQEIVDQIINQRKVS